jgi:hypothetical protein
MSSTSIELGSDDVIVTRCGLEALLNKGRGTTPMPAPQYKPPPPPAPPPKRNG